MKIRRLIAGNLAFLVLLGLATQALGQTTRLYSKPGGSKMRIEGTANIIHPHWAVEGRVLGGHIEVGPGFPLEPGQAATPGKMEASAEVFLMVRSLKSIEDDGSHYSDKMDDIMYEHFNADKYPKITFRLTELTLKEPAKSKDAPYLFEAKGDLVVSGVTNALTMPVYITPLPEKRLKVTGSTMVKMTSFNIKPPEVKILTLKAGDDVKLVFEWLVAQRTATAAAK
jgi:hypothetical protein